MVISYQFDLLKHLKIKIFGASDCQSYETPALQDVITALSVTLIASSAPEGPSSIPRSRKAQQIENMV